MGRRRPAAARLANLQGQLGLASAWLAFAPVVEFPWAVGRSCFVANAIVVVLVALPGVDAIVRTHRRRMSADRLLFAAALFPVAEFGLRHGVVSSLAPDLIVMALVPIAAAVWVRSPRNGLLAMALVTLAVTVKLSAAPLLPIAVAAAVWGGLRGRRSWAVVVLCLLAGLVCVARGIWLSGCPAFPSTVGRWSSLPWAVPTADAKHVERLIECWSKYHRQYAADLVGTPWVAGWVRRAGLSEPIVVPTVALLAGLVGLAVRRRPLTPAGRRAVVAAAVGMGPAIAFWFAVAPEVRFGLGYVTAAAALVVAAAWDGCRCPPIGHHWRCLPAAAAAVGLCVVARPDHRLLTATVVHWPGIPVARLTTRPAADGTAIYQPVGDDRVWAAPRPATPDLNPTLRCRTDRAGRIREFDVGRADGP